MEMQVEHTGIRPTGCDDGCGCQHWEIAEDTMRVMVDGLTADQAALFIQQYEALTA